MEENYTAVIISNENANVNEKRNANTGNASFFFSYQNYLKIR